MSEFHDAPHDRTVSAMGERVAVVETKIAAVEKDTAVIRSTCHSINGKMQEFVIQEAHCVAGLEAIQEFIAELKPKIDKLLRESDERHGAWAAWVVAGAAIVGAITVIGTIVTVAVLAITRFTGHP